VFLKNQSTHFKLLMKIGTPTGVREVKRNSNFHPIAFHAGTAGEIMYNFTPSLTYVLDRGRVVKATVSLQKPGNFQAGIRSTNHVTMTSNVVHPNNYGHLEQICFFHLQRIRIKMKTAGHS
jgi:hypothetical protein